MASDAREGAVPPPGDARAGAKPLFLSPGTVFGSLRFRLVLLVLLCSGPALGVVLHAGLARRDAAVARAEEAAQSAAEQTSSPSR